MAKNSTDERFAGNLGYHLGVMTASLEAIQCEAKRLADGDEDTYALLLKLIARIDSSFAVVSRQIPE